MLPQIFVIIPAYNVEAFIETSVYSVLNQPYKNINILIVNDGSKDNTGIIVDSLAKDNDRVTVIHQDNSGVSIARNNGLKFIFENKLKCDYIIFLDADDFWFDNVIMKELVASFNDFDIIGMSTYLSSYNATRFKAYNIANEKEITKKDRGIEQWPGGHFCSYFIKASNIQNYNLYFQENLRRNEDFIFIHEVFICSKDIKFFSKPLYNYRMNSQSATHTSKFSLENVNDVPMGWYKAKAFVDDINDLSDVMKNKWHSRCEKMIGTILLENAMTLAMNGFDSKQIKESILNNPLSHYYDNLVYEQLHDWHKKPYRMFNENIRLFVLYYRINGFFISFIKKISKSKIANKFIEKFKYPLLITDILN